MEQDCVAEPDSFLISVLFHPGSLHIDVSSYFGAHAMAGGRRVITEELYISELFSAAAITPGRLIDPCRRQTRQ